MKFKCSRPGCDNTFRRRPGLKKKEMFCCPKCAAIVRNRRSRNTGMSYDDSYNKMRALGEVISTAEEIGFSTKVVRKSEDD